MWTRVCRNTLKEILNHYRKKAQEILISVHLLREFHCNISSVFHRNSMSIVKLSLYLSSSFATLKSRSMFVSSAECSL